MDAITIENLDVVFGQQQSQALALLDQGKSRQEIIDETGQVVGVDNVSLTVKRGEICVLMGLSGSGKSSLLRTVNGLNGISRGSLKIQDGDNMVELANCNEQTLRHLRTHRVSMVFQKFALMPWLTVLDNVAFGLEMQGIGKAERRAKAREQLEMVGLSEWESKFPHELSGGMQQRVGLARAFAMDTDILLMDEPFSTSSSSRSSSFCISRKFSSINCRPFLAIFSQVLSLSLHHSTFSLKSDQSSFT